MTHSDKQKKINRDAAKKLANRAATQYIPTKCSYWVISDFIIELMNIQRKRTERNSGRKPLRTIKGCDVKKHGAFAESSCGFLFTVWIQSQVIMSLAAISGLLTGPFKDSLTSRRKSDKF